MTTLRHRFVLSAFVFVALGCKSGPTATLLPTTSVGPTASAEPTPSPIPTPTLPNGLVDIGGRSLEMYCRGSGSPAVILEAGLGNTASVWNAISTRVDAFTTVCAYNRAGLGASDERPLPHGAEAAAEDLEALLQASGLRPPYVLVGASYGGLVVQLFARHNPTETAGVVLVDALAPGWDDQLEGGTILTAAQIAERRAIPNGEPVTNEEIRASERAVAEAPPFPAVPLVVLRHGVPFPGGPDWPTDTVEALWLSLQESLAGLSSHSALLLAAESGHRIHQQQPDLVTDAIHAVVDPSRWPPSAPPPPIAYGTGAPVADLSSLEGLIAFTSEDGIHLARPDGSDDRLVVAGDGSSIVGEPSLDADATVLAYTVMLPDASPGSGPQAESPSELWLRELATGDAQMLAPHAQMPAVSVDGGSVAFTDRGHTYVVRADGTGLRDLGEGGCPIWSQDSSQLAMCGPDDATFVLRLSDLERAPFERYPGVNNPSAWSPDGSMVALFSTRDGNGEVYLANANGSGERRLTDAPGNQVAQIWTSAGLLVTSSLPGADVDDWFLVDPVTGSAATIPWLRGVAQPIGYAPNG